MKGTSPTNGDHRGRCTTNDWGLSHSKEDDEDPEDKTDPIEEEGDPKEDIPIYDSTEAARVDRDMSS